jgi:hypothetical protein
VAKAAPPAMGVQLVPYAAAAEGAFLSALNDAIAMTADCRRSGCRDQRGAKREA